MDEDGNDFSESCDSDYVDEDGEDVVQLIKTGSNADARPCPCTPTSSSVDRPNNIVKTSKRTRSKCMLSPCLDREGTQSALPKDAPAKPAKVQLAKKVKLNNVGKSKQPAFDYVKGEVVVFAGKNKIDTEIEPQYGTVVNKVSSRDQQVTLWIMDQVHILAFIFLPVCFYFF